MEHVQRPVRMPPLEMAELGVRPPTVVVVGDQAHGKSALVQALLGCRWATGAGQESARSSVGAACSKQRREGFASRTLLPPSPVPAAEGS
jgi:predicted ATPase